VRRRQDEYRVRLSLFRKEKERRRRKRRRIPLPLRRTTDITDTSIDTLRDVRVAEFESEMGKRRLRGPRRIIYQTSFPPVRSPFRENFASVTEIVFPRARGNGSFAPVRVKRLDRGNARLVLITRARLQPRT